MTIFLLRAIAFIQSDRALTELVLTVSSLVNGLYEINDVCLGLPTVVNEKGILKTINLALSEAEAEQLRYSARVLREVFAQLKF